jgi:hypothetical protein
VARFGDERFIELGQRLICIERPDCLGDAMRRDIEMSLARRVASTDNAAPWLTCERAMQGLDVLLAAELDSAQRQPMESLQLFLTDKLERARNFLG